MKKKEIRYCDSMSGNGSTILRNLLDYLQKESRDKKKEELNRDEWSLRDMKNSIPQQQNCSDCGVFTCVNAILSCMHLVCCCFSSLPIAFQVFSKGYPWCTEVPSLLYCSW